MICDVIFSSCASPVLREIFRRTGTNAVDCDLWWQFRWRFGCVFSYEAMIEMMRWHDLSEFIGLRIAELSSSVGKPKWIVAKVVRRISQEQYDTSLQKISISWHSCQLCLQHNVHSQAWMSKPSSSHFLKKQVSHSIPCHLLHWFYKLSWIVSHSGTFIWSETQADCISAAFLSVFSCDCLLQLIRSLVMSLRIWLEREAGESRRAQYLSSASPFKF